MDLLKRLQNLICLNTVTLFHTMWSRRTLLLPCSCQQSPHHPCLNDCLEVGPPFLIDICTLLLRFQIYNIALITDIEKAFNSSAVRWSRPQVYTLLLAIWRRQPRKQLLDFTVLSHLVWLYWFTLHATRNTACDATSVMRTLPFPMMFWPTYMWKMLSWLCQRTWCIEVLSECQRFDVRCTL